MLKCTCCKELINTTTNSYKVSSGFVDEEGNFVEDVNFVIHPECSNLIEPFQEIELLLKRS
jgi:hypothetical protein